jgi:hypothetical protein
MAEKFSPSISSLSLLLLLSVTLNVCVRCTWETGEELDASCVHCFLGCNFLPLFSNRKMEAQVVDRQGRHDGKAMGNFFYILTCMTHTI